MLNLTLQVAAVPEDVGTAGAIRAIARRLTAKDILVRRRPLSSLVVFKSE